MWLCSQVGVALALLCCRSNTIFEASKVLYFCIMLSFFSKTGFIDKFLRKLVPEEHHPQASLTIMMSMVLGLMPACKYGEVSYLMGVFISGLTI